MYAVIKTGGKQYKVTEGANLKVEKLDGEAGAALMLDEVLFIGGNGTPKIGRPLLSGASVEATIVRQARDKKVLVYKKKRRKGYEKKVGHRQPYTELKITKINA
ncbi:MAG: 50S ribosomal protein L21 [Proteobacteria bacterium]|nr:50S ribosomal protein L21 [Pseudomonadota bacterium]